MSEFAKGIVNNYFFVAGAQLVSIPLSLLYLSLVTRIMGPVNYGRFVLALATFQFFYTLCVSWVRSATIRFGTEEYTKHNKLNGIFYVQFTVLSFVVVFASSLILLFRKNIADFTGLSQDLCIYLVAYLVFYSIFDFVCQLLQAINKMQAYGLSLILRQGAVLVLFLLFIALRITIAPPGLLLIESVSYLFVVIISALPIWKSKYFLPAIFNKEILYKVLQYSWPMMVLFALGYFSLWTDTLLIRYFLDFESVGRYEAANRFAQYVSNLILPLSIVAFPIAVSIKSRGREDLIHKYAQRIIPQTSFFWGIFIIILMVCSGLIFNLVFGPQYASSVFAFQVLLIGLSFQFLSVMYNAVLQSYDFNRELVYILAISLALNLAGDLLLIPRIGIIGAAFSKSLSFTVSGLLYMYRSIRCADIQGKSYRNSALFLGLPLLPLAVVFLSRGNPLLSAISAVICIVASFIFVKQKKVFSNEDVDFIDQLNMPGFIKSGIGRIYKRLI